LFLELRDESLHAAVLLNERIDYRGHLGSNGAAQHSI
jgi:hypothetical protein